MILQWDSVNSTATRILGKGFHKVQGSLIGFPETEEEKNRKNYTEPIGCMAVDETI